MRQHCKTRSLSVDTSKITVDIKNQKSKEGNLFYNTTLHIFGVFADGAPVTLNMEIKVMNDKTASKVYLVFIASPLDKSNKIWTELHSIQNSFTMP
ncbi:MAG TPA: hypothetical protein VHB70_04930 [Parafilimonas sp.]|nr:hypothetical protein [Parafilimonas sp.]